MGAILLVVVVGLMARLSLSQIGGQTGDVLGALEQVGEIVILLVAGAVARRRLDALGAPRGLR